MYHSSANKDSIAVSTSPRPEMPDQGNTARNKGTSSLLVDIAGSCDEKKLQQLDAILRMPISFGPFPGPRQDIRGHPHPSWSDVTYSTATATFLASKAKASALLPHPCFHLDVPNDASKVYISLSNTTLFHLPWLGGRGYSHFGLYIHDVVCTGASEHIRGKYLLVLFENRADPILSGREELGYSKLWATLQESLTEPGSNRVGEASYRLDAGWETSTFATLTMEDLREDGAEENASAETQKSSYGPSDGLLHYKYIPTTGKPGVADVEYPTFSPVSAQEDTLVERVLVSSKARVKFNSWDWSHLPTLHHIVVALRDLTGDEAMAVEARIVFGKGVSDLRDHRKVG